ncbi:OmpW/AlkL family protein [Halotalea alkalilenta]|uniref:OmpW family protein n=1 Tax=Halotalea alkalilenta TaxID=376489 RepID=A0A172YHF1_9GAMM|nr:OmpW family outer membrane protein [Halotalea alkalilenta]ANF58688.1 hypothetical protein A5892_15460 [Halotalea alkalilenta]
MKTAKALTAALIAGGTLFGAQQALAYNAGDFFARIDATRVESTSSGTFDTERSFTGALGWMFADKFGVEFNTVGQRQDLDFTYGGNDATLKYRPFSLLAQFYPLGGTGAQVQPYIGAGATYTRFSDRDLPGGARVDSNSWDPTAQLGVDYFLTDWIAINGNVQYTSLRPDVDNGIRDDIKIDPLTIGAGVTFRF